MNEEEYQEELTKIKDEKDVLETANDSLENEKLELQTKLTETEAGSVDFEKFGGTEKAQLMLETLSKDEKFAEYVRSRNGQTKEQEAALQQVEAISQRAADKVYEEKVKPIADRVAEQNMAQKLQDLSVKYPGWQQYEKEVEKMAEDFPFKDKSDPTPFELETLVNMAARATDGDGATEVLQNEPIGEKEEGEIEISKNMTTEEAVDLALEKSAKIFW